VSNFLDNEFGFSSLGGGGGGGGEGNITGVGFADEVAFFFGETEIEGNNFLFFRPSVVRLSIGDSSVATTTLDVTGTTKATSFTIANGGTITSPSAGNINISASFGVGVAAGVNPVDKLTVLGSITVSTDLDIHIDGFSTVLNEIYSIGRTNFPETNSLTINSRSAITFGEGSTNLGGSQTMIIFDTGNVVIQNGGVFTDTTERLKVTGNVLVSGSNLVTTNSSTIFRGSGATAGTNVLITRNSSSTNLTQHRNEGRLYIGGGGAAAPIIQPIATAGVSLTGTNLQFFITSPTADTSKGNISFTTEESMTQTSDSANGFYTNISFAPTSGTA